MMNTRQKILLVEDDPMIRDVYQDILTTAGYEVVIATDGQEGLIRAEEGGYDLILLDVMMPKMTGLEVLTALKQKPPRTPIGHIILLTNLAQDPIVEDALKNGAHAYLIKSDLDPGQFLEKVKKFLY